MENKLIQYVDRFGTDCVKWDGLEKKYGSKDMLSMWVADMDFRCPECIHEALRHYMECGAYGYDMLSSRFNKAFTKWEKERHGFEVDRTWLRYCTGVVQAFYWCVNCMTSESDHVLVLPPVYYPFFNAVEETDRRLVESNLIWDGKTYIMNYEDIEEKIVDNDVKMLLFCSPHNPVGRVWHRDELEKLSEICDRHDVIIVSDEIHQDFVFPGNVHIPMSLVRKNKTVVLSAPSKTFNMAGMTIAMVIIPDDGLRGKWDLLSKRIHISSGNSFGYLAGEAAYLYGAPWVDALLDLLLDNYVLLNNRLLEKLPLLKVAPLEGTYLMWVDFGAYVKKEDMKEFFEKTCKIALDYGSWFHGDADTFVRFNIATKPEFIEKAADVIIEALKK